MKVKQRYIIWGVVFVCSIILTIIEYNAKRPKPLKEEVVGYVASEFSSVNLDIEDNVNHSSLKKKYSLKISNHKDKNSKFVITTDFDEISSSDYEVLGKTPLLVVLKQNEKNIKQYEKKGLLKCSEKIQMDEDDKVEINFKKLMDAVIAHKNWSEFGGNKKEIKIFYPDLTTVDGNLFKQFLLVTANDGSYPTDEKERKDAQEYVEKFLEQPNVRGVNVMKRLTGVDDIESDIYVTFENNILQLDDDEYEASLYLAYPTETVEKQVVFESISESGDEIRKIIKEGSGFMNIYRSIESWVSYDWRYRYGRREDITAYRNSENGICNKLNFKDAYNCIDIPEEFLKTLPQK